MINMNLPFLLGDRQAVRSGPIIFPLISNNWVGNLAVKDWYFLSKGGGGGGGEDIYQSCNHQFQSLQCVVLDFNQTPKI